MGGGDDISLSVRWLDLDQDGDLDLYVVNHTESPTPSRPSPARGLLRDGPTPRIATTASRRRSRGGRRTTGPPWRSPPRTPRDRRPLDRLLALARRRGALGGRCPHSAVAALDLDDDRDLDLVLWADGQNPRAVLNDRLGRFHAVEMDDLPTPEPVSGLSSRTSTRTAAPTSWPSALGEVSASRNTTERTSANRTITWEPLPTDATDWRAAVAPTSTSTPGPTWSASPASGDAPSVDWAGTTAGA